MSHPSKFVGIGDLHLDGRLAKYLPTELNEFVLSEVRLVLNRAVRQGIKLCVFYGDVGDKPLLSYRAHMLLLDLFREFSIGGDKPLRFILLKGNHDHLNVTESSMDLLAHMEIPNAQFVLGKPRTFFKNTDHPLMLLPWPHHQEVQRDGCTNVLHIETKGSVMDSGRASPTDVDVDKKAFCVAGHLHTNHKAGAVHYSGTLYQTSFGEKPEKFYHVVDMDRQSVKSVPHAPLYRLENLVINSANELDELIPQDPNVLVKLFIKSKVVIPEQALDKYPNVVKHNTFTTKKELESLVMEDFVIDDVSGAANFDVDMALSDWMDAENVDPRLKKRALRLNAKLGLRETAEA